MSKRGSGKRRGNESPQRNRQKSQSGGNRGRDFSRSAISSEKYYVCGINVMNQLMATQPERLIELHLLEDMGKQRQQRLNIDPSGLSVPVNYCDAETLLRLTGTENHQGVAAELKPSKMLDDDEALELLAELKDPLILILDSIQDPHNFGACLRTAESAGVDLVVVPRSRSVEITPVVSKVASGAAETQRVARVGNLARFMRSLQEMHIRMVGTDDEGEGTVYSQDLTGPLALVMGAEGSGMRRLTQEHCDFTVNLPMRGTVESLNLSVATGICLYEILRQRGVA
jgi:23S rRNA (guanosine2251-2'-O)-methyltransferase